MIHYTMVKTTFFNGVKHPDIGILHRDGRYQIVHDVRLRRIQGQTELTPN